MGIKLFYNGKWMAFIAPEKPEKGDLSPIESVAYEIGMEDYEQAYAEAKVNALEVGNPNLIVLDRRISMEPGECIDWPGSAVIKDGKYILSV